MHVSWFPCGSQWTTCKNHSPLLPCSFLNSSSKARVRCLYPPSHLTSPALPLTTHNKARLERSFHAGLCSLVWLFMCWGLSGSLHALVSYPLVSNKVLSPWLVLFSHSKLRLQLPMSCPIEDFWIYDTSFCLFCQWWLIWIWQAGWLLSWEQPLLRHMLQFPMACSGATRVVQEVQGLQLIESMRNW